MQTNFKIPNAGFKLMDFMPVIGLGTWNLKGSECIESVADAIDMGYRHIDTAQMYSNEHEVGQGINKSGLDRKSIFVTTKLAPGALNPSKIKSKTLESLDRLQMDYVDLLLIHWSVSDMDIKSILEKMFSLQEDGLARKIGVSNFSPTLYKQSLEIGPIFTNQLEFTPYKKEKENLEIAVKNNNVITAYSPLAQGSASNDKRLKEIGASYNKSASQVALRWLIQMGNISVIPKSASHKRRQENIDIFDFELSEEDMLNIDRTG